MNKLFMTIIAIIICVFSTESFATAPNIILFGLPASGKGTLSQKLINNEDKYVHISPGNLFRSEIKQKTNFGKKIEHILSNGDYVPENLTFAFLANKIKEAKDNNTPIIFDGYPRSEEALGMLDKFLNDSSMKDKTIILNLTIEPEKLLNRVLNRSVCSKCNKVYSKKQKYCSDCNISLDQRVEDTPEILQKRIKHYLEVEMFLLKMLEKKDYKVINIKADDDKTVFNDVSRLIDMYKYKNNKNKNK